MHKEFVVNFKVVLRNHCVYANPCKQKLICSCALLNFIFFGIYFSNKFL